VLLEAREIDPSPEGFKNAVLVALGARRGSGQAADLLAGAVLLVDGYEELARSTDGCARRFCPPCPLTAWSA